MPVHVGPEAMQQLEAEFPEGVLGYNHQITCELDNKHVGALIGRRGEFIHQVQRDTGTTIKFNEVQKGSDIQSRTLEITGPLLAVYTAHMKMMKRYHEAIIEEEKRNQPPPEDPPANDIDDLKAQLAMLQEKLAEAQTSGRDSKGSGRKGSKGGKR